MRRPSLPVIAIAVAPLFACKQDPLPPTGQLVVWIDTDAPLTSESDNANDPLHSPGLFDRLRLEILSADASLACTDCQRDFVVSQELLDSGGISFGVELPSSSAGTYRLRARLFPSEALLADVPPSDPTIDGLYALPLNGAEGVTVVTASLAFSSLGVPIDLMAAGDPVKSGRVLAGIRALPKTRSTCASAPASDSEVCVPGGVYWAGKVVAAPGTEPWRAVVISPFFVDAHEVTVRELRAAPSKIVTATDPKRRVDTDPLPCTYTASASTREDLPATCASAKLAAAYCAAQGKALPTLAQMEYMRSGLNGTTYVWGLDRPTCQDAVWGRAGDDTTCVALGASSPMKAGSGARDVLSLPGGDVIDLAGNVAEMLRDALLNACLVPGVATDPVCGTDRGVGALAGGSFASSATELLAYARIPVGIYTSPDPRVGFRCVRDE